MTEEIRKRILKLWKEGRNVWEISQMTKVPEPAVLEVVQSN